MIALGCDHGGYELKLEIKKYLDEKGIEYKDFGCDSLDSVDYPVYAKKVAHAIVDGECELFILKKCHVLFPLKIPVKRIHPDIVMVSCHQINPGIQNGGKQVIYFFQFP